MKPIKYDRFRNVVNILLPDLAYWKNRVNLVILQLMMLKIGYLKYYILIIPLQRINEINLDQIPSTYTYLMISYK
jgi:hypothetical protein